MLKGSHTPVKLMCHGRLIFPRIVSSVLHYENSFICKCILTAVLNQEIAISDKSQSIELEVRARIERINNH